MITAGKILKVFEAYFGGHFVTMATVKVELMPDFYAWFVVLNNQLEVNGEKQLSVFGSKGVKLAPECT